MKTAMINGKRESITYKTNSGMYTRFNHSTLRPGQYGADVYTTESPDYIVIVATSHNGSTFKNTTKVITTKQYESISDLYDPYNDYLYHEALMNELGFE